VYYYGKNIILAFCFDETKIYALHYSESLLAKQLLAVVNTVIITICLSFLKYFMQKIKIVNEKYVMIVLIKGKKFLIAIIAE